MGSVACNVVEMLQTAAVTLHCHVCHVHASKVDFAVGEHQIGKLLTHVIEAVSRYIRVRRKSSYAPPAPR